MVVSWGLCLRCSHGIKTEPCFFSSLVRRTLGHCRFFSLYTLQNAPPMTTFSQEASHEDLLWHCKNDRLDNALQALFNTCSPPSDDVYISLLKSCIKSKSLPAAKKVLTHVGSKKTEYSHLLGDYLVVTLARCGGMDDAWKVHCTLQHKTLFSWSALICGYADCGKGKEAFQMYQYMVDDGLEPDRFAYVSLFKACGSLGNLDVGRKLHNEVRRRGLTSNLYIANTILSMYGRCGSIEEAELFFREMRQHNIVSWNAMLSGYTEQGDSTKALLLYRQMHAEGVGPNELTFVMAIKACCHNEDEAFNGLDVGEALHADAHKEDFTLHLLVASTLMCMYGKYGNLAKAEGVFSRLSHHNVVTWSTLLKCYVEEGQGRRVLLGHMQMLKEGYQLDAQAYVLFFQACCSLAEEEDSSLVEGDLLKVRSLQIGRALHEDAKERGLALDAYVGGTILNMYGKCGSILFAEKVFNDLCQQDVVSWNVMLSAYVDQGLGEEALILYRKMMEAGVILDERSVVSTLQACIICMEQDESVVGVENLIKLGQTLYIDVCKLGFTANIFVGNTFINFYGKSGSMLEAEKVFILLSKCDIATWNVMLCVYLEHGYGELAMQLYRQLLEEGGLPDERTFVTILQACSVLLEDKEAASSKELRKLRSLEIVSALHADARKKGFSLHVFVANSLITSYAKCGALEEAELVFASLSGSSVVSWNAMLSAYIEQGQGKKALQLFGHMLNYGANPDAQTFVIVLQASCALDERQESAAVEELSKSFHIGQALHAEARIKGLATNIFVGNTLTRMYGKHGRVADAVDVFHGLSQRNVVSWNAMLSGLSEQGDGDQALQLFRDMLKQGVPANDITLVCVLQACSETGHLEVCWSVHFSVVCSGLDQSSFVATTIVHAYGSCASMANCQAVFVEMHEPPMESWNSILTAFAGEGNLVACAQLFGEVLCRDSQPTRVTFFAVLMACSHLGLVEGGLEFFLLMVRYCKLSAEIKHYVIMVDLLGRAGDFGKVECMLSRMPMQPDLAFWLCLLSACRVHGHVGLGTSAYTRALQLQPNDAAVYVSMSNIHADARRIAYTDVLGKA